MRVTANLIGPNVNIYQYLKTDKERDIKLPVSTSWEIISYSTWWEVCESWFTEAELKRWVWEWLSNSWSLRCSNIRSSIARKLCCVSWKGSINQSPGAFGVGARCLDHHMPVSIQVPFPIPYLGILCRMHRCAPVMNLVTIPLVISIPGHP